MVFSAGSFPAGQAPPSREEGERLGGEVCQIRENRGEIGSGHAEPIGERRAVLIDRGCGNPTAIAAHVAGATGSKDGHGAVNVATGDGAAHDHLHAAPGMVAAAIGGGLVGAAEVGHGERGDIRREVQFHGGIVESIHCWAELRKERLLGSDLVAVRIEAPQGTEENLAIQGERRAHGNELSDLLQLAADARRGEYGGERRQRG